MVLALETTALHTLDPFECFHSSDIHYELCAWMDRDALPEKFQCVPECSSAAGHLLFKPSIALQRRKHQRSELHIPLDSRYPNKQ